MTTRIGGFRKKTRQKLKKPHGTQGKISLRKFLQEFKLKDRVYLKAEPAVQKGMFHPRFYGRAGVVTKKLGNCYEVTIKYIGKEKRLIVHPVHLVKA